VEVDSKKTYKSLYKYGYLLLLIPVPFLIYYYYHFNPEASGDDSGIFPRCIFNAATGLHCPGCGSQRAIHDMLHFRLFEAFKHNAFVLVVALVIFSKGYALFTKRYFPKYYYDLGGKTYFTYGLIIFLFLFLILRNIPVYPFTLLAP